MKPLRKFLDSLEPLFSRGGRFEKFEAIYEMVDTLFYSPADVTRSSPHVRDAIDALPEGLRATVHLRLFEGLSFEEIGRMLDRNEVAVRKRYSRALAELRTVLDGTYRTHFQAEG